MNTNNDVVRKRPKTAVTVNKDKFIFVFLNILIFNELLVVLNNTFSYDHILKKKQKKRPHNLWGQVMGNLIFKPIS